MTTSDAQLALYERIVETASEGVLVIDAASRTRFANPSMARMLGYDRAELVGRSLVELVDEPARQIVVTSLERWRQGTPDVHELAFQRKDGRPLWARLATNPIHDEAGRYDGALALATDLTVERSKDVERERLWQILDESLNEIYLFREHDLRFEYANHGALANLGFTLAQMRAMTPVDIKPDHTRESFAALVAPLVEGREAKLVFQTIHRRRDGSRYPVEVHLQLVGPERLFVAIIHDISERERARAREAKFQALVEHSVDILLLADASARFTYASPSVKAVLGYTPEQLIAMNPIELIHPEDRAVAGGALVQASSRTYTERMTFRVRHGDGSWRTLSADAHNLLDNPQIGALVLNARDVTAERRLEEQLQQSQRLESVGRLAGGVAHDFNNILTAILGNAAFLEEDATLGTTARGDVQEIKRAAQRASELTNQLLAFARRRVIRPQVLSLREVVVGQERFLRRVLGETIELTTHFDDEVWPVFVDVAQIEQVTMNLAINARDAMAAGGRLTIEVHNVELDDSFATTHNDVTPGAYVRLVVSDTGEGIAAEVLPHIFEPFFTTKAVGVGTGLGLATVYGIVRQSGGHIWVYSEPGVGTTFKCYFPRAERPGVVRPPAAERAIVRGTEHVLVVEDDATVSRMVVRALEAVGYRVHAERSPMVGLAWARAQQGRFHILVTDVVMPGMSGQQLAEQLTAEFPAVRVLYISGYTENTIVHRGVLDEGIDFLAKPFAPSELQLRVRAILDRS